MNSSNLAFFYVDRSHVEKHVQRVVKYLQDIEGDLQRISKWRYIVVPNGLKRHPREVDEFGKGNLFLYETPDKDPDILEELCNHILSPCRTFTPEAISCSYHKDYQIVKDILNINFAGKKRLSSGILEFLFNQRRIISLV